MKEQVLQAITNLDQFIESMNGLSNNPYSLGLDTNKLLQDLTQFSKDLREMVEAIQELPDSEEEEINE